MNQPMNQPGGTPNGGFDLNKSTIISLCYLGSFVTGFSGLVGVILSYVWRPDVAGTWEESHLTYLARTFWIGLVLSVIGVILSIVIVGLFILFAAMAQLVVRSIFSIIRAQKQEPMPDPTTLLW